MTVLYPPMGQGREVREGMSGELESGTNVIDANASRFSSNPVLLFLLSLVCLPLLRRDILFPSRFLEQVAPVSFGSAAMCLQFRLVRG